jgi:hypothetical protein
MSDLTKIILGMVFTAAMSISASTCATQIQINRVEERESNHFAELSEGLSDTKTDLKTDIQGVKSDLQGIRAEIMGILRGAR